MEQAFVSIQNWLYTFAVAKPVRKKCSVSHILTQ